jgi:hypothetical protein
MSDFGEEPQRIDEAAVEAEIRHQMYGQYLGDDDGGDDLYSMYGVRDDDLDDPAVSPELRAAQIDALKQIRPGAYAKQTVRDVVEIDLGMGKTATVAGADYVKKLEQVIDKQGMMLRQLFTLVRQQRVAINQINSQNGQEFNSIWNELEKKITMR